MGFPPLKKSYPAILLAANLAVAGLTITAFYSSPYTGIRADYSDRRAFVREVDENSPAETAGIKAGDLLVDIGNSGITPQTFSRDPDLIASKKEQRTFWEGRKTLNRILIKGGPALFQLNREDRLLHVTVVPADFPYLRIIERLWVFYVCGIAYVGITYLVLRKTVNEASHALFLLGSFYSMMILTFANSMSDLTLPVQPHRTLSIINHVGLFGSMYSYVHLALVFPRRKKILERLPWIVPAIYCALAINLAFDFSPVPDNWYLIEFFAWPPMALGAGMLIADFVREKDLVARKQVQWVMAGLAVYILWGGTTIILWTAGVYMPPAAVILPMIAVPVSWAVAVTKYRLMDIDDLFDRAVIFVVTIAVIEALELLLVGIVSPHIPLVRREPYLSFSALLLIVLLYLPVRTRVKSGIERLFKRNSYMADEEIRKFIIKLSGCDTAAILDGFISFAQDLLGPSATGIIQFRNDIALMVQTRGERARGAVEHTLAHARELRDHLAGKREAVFGYELADTGVLDLPRSGTDMGGALFLSVFVGTECSYIVVLLPKWNGSPYTRKDRVLLQAVSTSMDHALEADKRRGELEQERLRLAREIHDGISSEFTGILAYGEQGAISLEEAPSTEAARAFFTKIVDASRRGIRELRNIIWALNAENHSLQFLSSYIKRYASDLLNVSGISVAMREGDRLEDALLPPPVFLALFRTAQELCQNVIKHSGADSVTIDLRVMNGGISLSFADNGRGFPSGPERRTAGYGLNNIRKRVADLGGAMEVSSASDHGAVIEVSVPLA